MMEIKVLIEGYAKKIKNGWMASSTLIAGDVFWWTNKEKQTIDMEKIDDAHPAEVNMKKLIISRKKILKLADYIIPGHGKMFKVKK